MTDSKLPPLADDVRALLRRAAAVDSAPAAARARVLAGVETLVGPGGGSIGDAGGGGAAPGSALPPIAATATMVPRALALMAIVALGGGVAFFAWREEPPRPTPVRPVPPPAAILVETPGPSAAPRPPAEVPTTTTTPTPSSSRAPTTARDTLTAERRLLDAARAALEHADAPTVLALTAQHQRRFPNGVLVQEREAMAIRALVKLDRADDARARAGRFRAHFPDSLLLPVIDAATGSRSRP